MGIIKAALSSVKGTLADQWLEVIEAADMGDDTVFCEGTKIRKGENVKGSEVNKQDPNAMENKPTESHTELKRHIVANKNNTHRPKRPEMIDDFLR